MVSEWLVISFLTVLALLAGAAAITWVPASWAKWRRQRALDSRCVGKLVLTYDDGPDPLLTPLLADILRRYQVKATFFLVGFRAHRSPEMCDLLAAEGHELGCHTQRHKRWWKMMPWRAVREVSDGYRTMSRWLSPSAPFRPPFGKLTTWTWLALRRRGAPICWWTCDGGDTWDRLPDPQQVVREVIDRSGAVVLMHFHDRGKDRQDYVLALTERLLEAARDHGMTVCTMSDVLGKTLQGQGGQS